MNQKIGTCSLCGGCVVGPTVWHGINQPPVWCETCGATGADHGPVIKMTRLPRSITSTGTTIRTGDEEEGSGHG